MTWSPGGRDGIEVEALITDRYLESLLRPRLETSREGSPGDDLDPSIRDLALRLTRGLPRFHPSFRFEEALSARLAAAALARRTLTAAGAEGVVIPIRGAVAGATGTTEADLAAYLDGTPVDDESADHVRPLLIGGALTSAAISLAGAAYVAWRLRRPVSRTRLT